MTRFSIMLLQELQMAVELAMDRDGVVNVPAIAWALKMRFPEENASIAELESQVMAWGMSLKAAMFFQRPEAFSGQELLPPSAMLH